MDRDRAPLLRVGFVARGAGGLLQGVSATVFLAASDHAAAAISRMLGGDRDPSWSATVGAFLGADPALLHTRPASYFVGSLVAVALALALGLVGLRLHRRGRQLTAAAVEPAVAGSDRPFVLYLRPFDADLRFAGMGQLPPPIGSIWTFEEQLREAVAAIGELRAINEPGRAIPATGALRRDVADWRRDVQRSMNGARLVIIVLGTSPGVRWEVEEAVRRVAPHRLLLLTPTGRAGHEEVRAALGGIFPYGLPAYPPGRPVARFPVGCAIWFGRDWQPLVVRLDRVMVGLSRPLTSAFVRRLRPVFEAVGTSWPGRGSWFTGQRTQAP
jgi:hypothetical protein